MPPTKRTRAKQPNWFKTKTEYSTVSQPVATFPVNALMPRRNNQQGGTKHLQSDTFKLIGRKENIGYTATQADNLL